MTAPLAPRHEVDELVRSTGCTGPRPRTPTERARTTARVAKLGATPVVIVVVLAWLKKVALAAALGAAGLGVAVATVAYVKSAHRTAALAPAAPMSASGSEPASVAAPSVPTVAEAIAPASTEPSPTVSTHGASGPPRASYVDPGSERELLDRAYRALGTSPAEALRLCNLHAATFARGRLGAEREMLAIEALSRLGRHAEAKARAAALLRALPHSIYEERLRRIVDEHR
jgi:hypothetical protein